MNDALLFDLDGTLWDSVPAVVMAWNEILDRYPEAPHLTEEAMRGYMGKTSRQIAHLMMPLLPEADSEHIINECEAHELNFLHTRRCGYTLYPDLIHTLKMLAQNFDLFIVSNCGHGYIETFLDLTDTWSLFAGHICPGDTGLLKADNITLLLQKAGHPCAVYIGDTETDERAALEAGIPFVHAAYGFGHAATPSAVLQKFSDLPVLAQRLFAN